MIKTEGRWFKDEYGRTAILRGVNLGTKVPSRPEAASHLPEFATASRDVSFVGRPFPLKEADEHFTRLRAWGLTFLRLMVPWEAIEHQGPGIYDLEYLDYIDQVVAKAGEYGIDMYIDPHQDVWCRQSGGDGAPGWIFELLGLDAARFAETGAAIVHCCHEGPLPSMIWPSNYTRLAAATAITLFYGGNDFAPRTTIDGLPAQEFLQQHYFDAVKQVTARLKDRPNVIGYDIMNEPNPGYIGWEDLSSNGEPQWGIHMGDMPTPYQQMLLGSGFPQTVEFWQRTHTSLTLEGYHEMNPVGAVAWAKDRECIWRQNGIWEMADNGEPRLLRPHHFAKLDGRQVDFANDYLQPFTLRYAREIRSIDPDAIIFFEGGLWRDLPRFSVEEATNMVHAPHWYDFLTMDEKNFTPDATIQYPSGEAVSGREAVRKYFALDMARQKARTAEFIGDVPTLFGEIGIPFDMVGKEAYRTGDFSLQIAAMDASLSALEANLLSATIWTYCRDNSNEWGDLWNGEDYSIFSRDQQTDPEDINSGGRALEAVLRPYARRTAGEPQNMAFDLEARTFDFEFSHDPGVKQPTEVFVPNFQYPEGYNIQVSDGTYEIDSARQILTYHHSTERPTHWLHVYPKNSATSAP